MTNIVVVGQEKSIAFKNGAGEIIYASNEKKAVRILQDNTIRVEVGKDAFDFQVGNALIDGQPINSTPQFCTDFANLFL